ncbi:sulfotransferase 1B1-like [Haliotis rufescens]|uniref:sulfotransferase 1B1-like n=1 Tax=Haliotis rufescens TaxID=6454 RepID=UPI00201E8142|nr:sulfotransferase 1B1-like [Haliotis rufescens]
MAERVVKDKSGNIMTVLDPRTFSAKTLSSIQHAALRDDDILLYGYPRSGHHWLFEIVNMLVTSTADYVPFTLESGVLELQPDTSLRRLSSPRILTTHVQAHLLPRELQQRNVRTVHIIRDPKDVAVSWFHFYHAYPEDKYEGSWDDWLHLFISDKFMWGTWFDHIRSFEKMCESLDPSLLHIIFYEDLKKNTQEEVQKLARFLETDVSNDVMEEIVLKSAFSEMKSEKDKITEKWNGKPAQYRKGIVGDWLNMFTPYQKEIFHDIYRERMHGSRFQTRYDNP